MCNDVDRLSIVSFENRCKLWVVIEDLDKSSYYGKVRMEKEDFKENGGREMGDSK